MSTGKKEVLKTCKRKKIKIVTIEQLLKTLDYEITKTNEIIEKISKCSKDYTKCIECIRYKCVGDCSCDLWIPCIIHTKSS